jgi:DNA processing protein
MLYSKKTWLVLHIIRGFSMQFISNNKNIIEEINFIINTNKKCFNKLPLPGAVIEQLNKIDWKIIDKQLYWENTEDKNIITIEDDDYPQLLKEIAGPPKILFVKGNKNCLFLPSIAIVGSRNPTHLGEETAYNFANYFAKNGFVVVSGLAIGIDSASHRGAITSGKTIAVVATGIDTTYPQQNVELSEQITAEGAVISEFFLGTSPKREYFPRRNRIISGMSLGVLVVEASINSGSLITAKLAIDQGREVFAIPGSIHSSLSKGCHYLIKQGAKLVEQASDVVDELFPSLNIFSQIDQQQLDTNKSKTSIVNKLIDNKLFDDKRYSVLLEAIEYNTVAIDMIIVRSGLKAEEVGSMLLLLELHGYVHAVPGGYVRV